MHYDHRDTCPQQEGYRTGSTRPPKSHQGLIAFLLTLVIFLGGIVSALGMMNIRLFRELKERQERPDSLATANYAPRLQEAQTDSPSSLELLGLTGQVVSDVFRYYNNWPAGLYINSVAEGSPAANAGIRAGDILVSINGSAVTTQSTLTEVLSNLSIRRVHPVTVFREDRRITLPLILEVQHQ